MVTDSIKIKHV